MSFTNAQVSSSGSASLIRATISFFKSLESLQSSSKAVEFELSCREGVPSLCELDLVDIDAADANILKSIKDEGVLLND